MMTRVTCAGVSGTSCDVAAHTARILPGMSSAPVRRRSSGSITARPPGKAAAAATSSSTRRLNPVASHARLHSSSSQSPVTFLRKRVELPTPSSLVTFSRRASSVVSGAASSHPMSAHVPHEM